MAHAMAGVEVDLRGYGIFQKFGAIHRQTFLKNAKGRLYYFLVPRLIFSKSKLSRRRSLVHVGNLC